MTGAQYREMTDEQLCSLAQGGDAAAADVLTERYTQVVRAIARRFYMYKDDTEDLIQEGIYGMYSAVLSYTPEKGPFRPYANTCVRNRILDTVRKIRAAENMSRGGCVPLEDADGEKMESPSFNPEDEAIKTEDGEEFGKTLESVLSPLEASVMKLYLAGMNKAEISAALSLEEKSVSNAVSRSYRKLQKYYTMR